MRKLCIIGAVILLSACSKANEKVDIVVGADKTVTAEIPDYTEYYKEVCVDGFVYYVTRSGGSYAVLTHKIVEAVNPMGGKYQRC